jgi:thiaminase
MSGKSKSQVSTVANNKAGTAKNDIKKSSSENPALQASPFGLQPLSQAADELRLKVSPEEYEDLAEAKLKAASGLVFNNIVPFTPITQTILRAEPVNNIEMLARRLQHLYRTIEQDLLILTGSQEVARVGELGQAWLKTESQEKAALSGLQQLSYDERLTVLDMLAEVKCGLNAKEGQAVQETLEVKAVPVSSVLPPSQGAKETNSGLDSTSSSSSARTNLAAVTSSAKVETKSAALGERLHQLYEQALLEYDYRQGWARMKPSIQDDKKSEAPMIEKSILSPQMVNLRQQLEAWLDLASSPSLVKLQARIAAVQDYCRVANRLVECSAHWQHETELAQAVLKEFSQDTLKNEPAQIEAVCQLAAAQSPELTQQLLKILLETIKSSSTVEAHILEGLTIVLHHAPADLVDINNLSTTLSILIERSSKMGSELSKKDTVSLLQAIGAVLTSLALISQQRCVPQQTSEETRETKDSKSASTQQAEPLPSPSATQSVFSRVRAFFKCDQKATTTAATTQTEISTQIAAKAPDLPAMTKADHDALCDKIKGLLSSLQERYEFAQLKEKNPDLFFAVNVIQQALFRLPYKEQPDIERFLTQARQFLTILESAKNVITGFSITGLFETGQQLYEFIEQTPLGDAVKDFFGKERVRPEVWFEHYLILKTLVASDQLALVETQLISGKLPLSYPLTLGCLQLFDCIIRWDQREAVRASAMQFLNLLTEKTLWEWPETFSSLQQRLQKQCEDYSAASQPTLTQRLGQQAYKKAQAESQHRLRQARHRCQQEKLSYQWHDYCLAQLRQADKDAVWQDIQRYIPVLAKSSLTNPDESAKLCTPDFERFFNGEAADRHRTLLILGDAGTGKSLFIRRNHLQQCARYFARQFEATSATLGSAANPLSLYLSLNQSPVEEPVESYLLKEGFTDRQVRDLREGAYLLLHLDGYDEWSSKKENPWLYAPKTLDGWSTNRNRVIVTCRSQYLQGDANYLEKFAPAMAGSYSKIRDYAGMMERVFTHLDPSGVERFTRYYVEEEVAQNRQDWNVDKYIKQFKQSGIEELVRTPIILLMALRVLPRLEKRHGNDKTGQTLLRYDIYQEFIAQYIDEQRQKIASGGKDLGGIAKAAPRYAEALALQLFIAVFLMVGWYNFSLKTDRGKSDASRLFFRFAEENYTGLPRQRRKPAGSGRTI